MGLFDGVLEEDREVVDDGIASADLLHELRAYPQHHPAEMLRLSTCKDRLERRPLAACVPGSADRVHDDLFLELGFLVVDLEPSQRCDDRLPLFVPLASEEPTGGFGHVYHPDDHNQRKHNLKRDGKPPREVRGAVRSAVIDPVSGYGSERDDTAFDADQQAAVGGAAALGLVGGDCGGVDAVAEAGYGAADDELREGVGVGLGSDLNYDAEDHDAAADHHGAPAAEVVAEGEDEDGAEETTCKEGMRC